MYLLVSLSGQVSLLISCDLALICTFEFENVSLSLYVGSRKRQLALAFHVGVCLQNTHLFKVEKILKGSLFSIPSPSPSVKIQIMGVKVYLRCKGKTLLDIANKLLKTKSLLTSARNVLPYYLK